jgi:hypothetical protein
VGMTKRNGLIASLWLAFWGVSGMFSILALLSLLFRVLGVALLFDLVFCLLDVPLV